MCKKYETTPRYLSAEGVFLKKIAMAVNCRWKITTSVVNYHRLHSAAITVEGAFE